MSTLREWYIRDRDARRKRLAESSRQERWAEARAKNQARWAETRAKNEARRQRSREWRDDYYRRHPPLTAEQKASATFWTGLFFPIVWLIFPIKLVSRVVREIVRFAFTKPTAP